MQYYVQLDVSGSSDLAQRLRRAAASLRGGATGFFMSGVHYKVVQPGVVEANDRHARDRLPRIYSGLIRQVKIVDVVEAERGIVGEYRHDAATARVARLHEAYSVVVTAPSLTEAKKLYNTIISGKGGRYRQTRGGRR